MISDKEGLQIAYEEAKAGFEEGGVPIGAALVSADGKLLGKGRNLRVQLGSPIHHGETSALFNTGRLPASAYKGESEHEDEDETDRDREDRNRLDRDRDREAKNTNKTGSTMYTTLSPCDMCTGACLLYGIARVVIGENKTFLGGEAYLKSRGVEVVVLEDAGCQALMDAFIEKSPELWNEDIGVEKRVYSKEAQ